MSSENDFLQRFGKLSQVDLSIMQDIANDVEKDVIAKKCDLTVKQIYSKIEAIKKKIGVYSQAAGVYVLYKNNLIK